MVYLRVLNMTTRRLNLVHGTKKTGKVIKELNKEETQQMLR